MRVSEAGLCNAAAVQVVEGMAIVRQMEALGSREVT